MTDLLPAWDKSVTDIARRTKDASRLMKATADKMEFRVPTGLEFEGVKPRISWSVWPVPGQTGLGPRPHPATLGEEKTGASGLGEPLSHAWRRGARSSPRVWDWKLGPAKAHYL